MNSLVTIGAFVQGMATLVFVANLVISYFKGKKAGNHPWNDWALEWSGRCMQEKKEFLRMSRLTWRNITPTSRLASAEILRSLPGGNRNRDSENHEEVTMASGSSKEALAGGKGIIDRLSNHSVDQTVEKLKSILQSKGINLFALVDHSGEAEKVGMKMRPTKLLIFGSPKAGTPLMLAAPSVAIDLPLKILVWQDGQGKVWLSYNSLDYLKERHGLPQELLQNIAGVETLAAKAGE